MSDAPFWGDKLPTEEPNAVGVPEHLGGHFNYTNMDTETLDYLAERFKVKSMLDVGCGPGGMVDYARTKDIEAFGVDGDPNMKRNHIAVHDFLDGTYNPKRSFDLIWCVEFVEHVAEIASENFLATFRYGDHLMMTHALPVQGGHHHVNLQWSDYWIKRLYHDWELDREATNHIRTFSRVIPYVKHTALVWNRVGGSG